MRRRAARLVGVGLGALFFMLAVGIVVLTMTDVGRDRVRLFSLDQLAERIRGHVEIERVRGNLLVGATLENVTITDPEGRLFLSADTLSLRYSIRSLFQKHLVFTDVRAVRPIVVFDQLPGERWNVERIFSGDTVVVPGDTIPGFGDWVRVENLTVVDGFVTVKREWVSDEAEPERVVSGVVAPDHREMIIPATGGYQSISTFREVQGQFPLIRFAHPDSAARVVDVGFLSTVAYPFQPPPARVQALAGRLTITRETLGFHDVRVFLPDSRLRLDGSYAFSGPERVSVRLRGEPVSLPDLRWLRPSLPEGGGRLDLAIARDERRTLLAAREMDLRVEGGRLRGFAELETGEGGTRLQRSDVRFTELDTRTLERLADGLDVPVDGVLGGHLRLAGVTDRFDVDGWATIRERSGATSRIEATGGVVNRPDGIVGRDLRLRFDPLRLTLARSVRPDLPLSGTVTGRATLNGPLESVFDVDADLVHRGPSAGRSRVVARGGLRLLGGLRARALDVRFDPLQSELVRDFEPDFPVGGTITGRATLDGDLESLFTVDADLAHHDPVRGRSNVRAVGDVRLADGLRARNLRLRVDPLHTDLVRVFDPGFPAEGTITGRATLDGDLDSFFTVDADLVHEAPATGRSHLVAEGRLRLRGDVAARNLRVRMAPLRLGLVRAFEPGLPLDGAFEGRATLTGTVSTRMAAALDVTHHGSTGTSALAGDVEVAFPDGIREFDVDVQARPLSLATVGLFAPRADLRGSVTGTIVARGTPERATVRTDLEVAGGGAIASRGTVGVGRTAEYDLRNTLTRFDASAVTGRAPPTALTGFVSITGVGTDLATARALVDASLVDSELEGSPRFDSTRVRARLEEGLAVFERGRIRLASASADVEGSFGLVEGRTGTLRYTVTMDSISRFSGLVPPDTGVVAARPMPRAREIAAARADSLRIAEDALVESVATGRPPPSAPALDTAPPLPRDSISGGIRAEGVLIGNLTRFDTRGRAVLDDVVFRGATVGSGDVDYEVLNARTEELAVNLDANLEDVRVDGFAFDEATVRVEHLGGTREGSGRAEVAVVQDRARDYRLHADYLLALDRSELRLEEMVLRFDTTRWTSTRPGFVRWGGEGVEIEHIELTNEGGGRVFAHGQLPDGGPGELRIEVDSLQIAQVTALVQDTLATRGLLSLDATVRGSLRAPLIAGALAVDSLLWGEERIPAVRATFEYADRELTARTEVRGEDRALLEGDVRLPVDLALVGREGPRLLDGALFADLRLDSLSVETLPLFTDQVRDLRGRLRGDVVIRGTRDAPDLGGDLELDLVSAHITGPDVVLRDGFGSFRLRGQRIHVDSLVASSGGGPVRVVGTVDVESPRRPELALHVTARDAIVLDNDRGRLRADLDLDVEGPIRALVVEGEARVQSGEITVPDPERYRRLTDLQDPVLAEVLDSLEVPLELRSRNALLESVRADVRVYIDRDTWLRNRDLNVEVYTPAGEPPLWVTTDPEQRSLSILGVVHTDRGEFSFAGRKLELNSGSVTFLGDPNRDLFVQLNAQYEVPRRNRETLVILINVGGPLSEPSLTLSSNQEPPLPESDLLSYLAFGRASSSLLAAEGSGIMGEALGGLGILAEQQLAGLGLGALADAVFSRIERRGTAAGLDLFRVHSSAIPDELNYSSYFGNFFRGIEVEAGEYFGENFFVLARTRPAEQTLPGLEFEYRTPGGFSWITSWDLRYVPGRPSLGLREVPRPRVLGSFVMWRWRF